MEKPPKVGRYEIREELGRGAMGVVYRAVDPAVGREVAVKTIISVALAGPHGEEFRERFFREARTAGALSHPGIVSIFDVGEHQGSPYLVMEFIPGPTLGEFARHRERLSADRIAELGAQIAEALGYAHGRGVVHRDIKPANILMTSGQAHGIERPKITDFGVAKLAEQHTTVTGKMVGTPAYMPPEQFTGAPIDGRSDIFSLGVLLYWLATGEQPFPGESITSVSYKVVNTDPAPPRRLNPALPSRLDAIILKCMAKSPEDRYQNAHDLARELGEVRLPRAQQTGAVEASPPPLDPNATVFEAPLMPAMRAATASMTMPPQAAAAAPAVRAQKNSFAVIAAAAVPLIALSAWFAMRPTPEPSGAGAAPETSTSGVQLGAQGDVQAGAGTNAAAAPVPQKVAATNLKPAADAGPGKPSAFSSEPGTPTPPTAQPATPPVAETAPEPVPSPPARPLPVDFDPRALDRRTSARVEFDVSRMPPGLDFIVEMNDRIYYEKTGPAAYKKTSELYVPTGVHEFRVVARSGGVEKSSNTVSTDFKANKRSTLKIELRVQGKPAEAGMPAGLYPDSQLVLTLR